LFFVVQIPEYAYEEFSEIAVTRLRKVNVDKILAVAIAQKVWNELGSKDIRDVIKMGRLATTILGVLYE
jgi:repressor of nif and glnA expression